jgi:hypothetical protein
LTIWVDTKYIKREKEYNLGVIVQFDEREGINSGK